MISLFPNEDILTKEEIESWKAFADSLNDTAINAKGEPFPDEPLIMALLLLSQHKMIDWLTKQISKYESLIKS